MKKTNKLISILLVMAMLLSMAPLTVFAASVEASGKFGASGSNLTWSLDSDGVLTVSGSGAMEDFANASKVPWYSKRTKVKTVVIESGVTNIGKDAFTGISSLVNATISDTVTSIGNRAFSNSGLTNFEFSDAGNLKTIGNSAFNSTQIKNMVIPDGVTTLGSYIFGYGPIKSVTIPASVTSVGNYFFEETSGLNEVIFLGNKEPETIGDTVFLGCSSLAYVSVPADYEGDTFSNMKVSKSAASVAEVNGQGFATLADAISAAQSINGAVLKLLSHISIDSGITIESGNFTIDLNGKELFSNGYFLLRVDGADVTIVDSAGGGIFNASNDQGNIVLEVLSGSANISGGTFNSASYPATVRDGTLKLTGKDFVLNGNLRIGWYGGSVDLSACTADEVRIQACADGLQASAVTLPDGWGLFKTDGTPCTELVKNDIYVAKAGFKVTASVNPAEGGTVEGAGTYSSGATVTLTASAANGYRFVNWTQNGEEVSASAVYTFTASENRELTANFEIVPHTHSFTYSASGDTITAVCANADGNCPDPEGTLTILPPADLYVDGTPKEATVENNLPDGSAAVGDITYSTASGTAPFIAGTHSARVTVGGATATLKFTLLNYTAMVTDKDGNELSGSPYKTLADAITAAEGSEGSTVTLLDRTITLSETQNIDSGKFTLDLNGKKLINNNGRVLYINKEADFTIKDSGEGGTIENKYEHVDCIENFGKLTVESGIIKGDSGIRNYGVLYFKDGTVEADFYAAIINYSSGSVYVYDGVLKGGENSPAVDNNGTLYFYDGEIKGITNVNTVYISGGTIDRDDYAALNLIGGTAEVTGGSFTGTDNEYGDYSGAPFGEWTIDIDEGASLILKGGDFPNGFVVDETTANALLAEDYYYKDADGKFIDVADDAKIINGYVKVSKGADFANAVITLDSTEFTYNGSEIKPTVIVTVGGKTLTEGKDYNLTFANNVNVGTATVTVTGAGDYTGEATADFTIETKPIAVTVTAPDKIYDGTINVNLSEVTVNVEGIVGADEVTVTVHSAKFSTPDAGENKTVTVAYEVSGAAADNYDFYGDDVYFPEHEYYIAEATATIAPKSIHDGFIILGDPLTYNGTEQTQTVEKVLPTGTAPEATYTVSGNKATNVGVYLLTVTGTGNFSGEAKIAFEIAPDVECISHLDRVEDNGVMKWNVKSTDRESLEYVVDQLNKAVTDIADADTKNEWADTKEACEDMLRVINSIELSIADVEEDYAGFSEDTVKSSDIPALDKIVGKINEIKERYSFNLTDEEAKKLEDILDGIEKLKAKIAETAEEIERIDEAVNGYDKETVTSDDVPELGKLIEDIKALTDGDNLTEDEKAALEETDKAIDDLVEKLTEVAEEIKRVDEAVKSYDEETVKSTDKEDLSQLKEDIQSLIDSNNTTENEKTALEELIKDIEGLEDKIDETENQLDEIAENASAFNSANITDADVDELKAIIEAIDAVNTDNLTNEQKAEIEATRAEIVTLLKSLSNFDAAIEAVKARLGMFSEERVTIFWEEDINALIDEIDALLAEENMNENDKATLNGCKAEAEHLIEVIKTPEEYISVRFFYFIWDCVNWKIGGLSGWLNSIIDILIKI